MMKSTVLIWVGLCCSFLNLAESDGVGDDLISRLFSVTCEGEEDRYSDWTTCVWPSGDLRPLVRNFVRDAKSKGCKMPPPRLIKIALKALKKSDYVNHPLYKKVPSTECGFCGRKAQCCRKARSFLTQSFRSDTCYDSSSICEVEPLTEEDRNALGEMYGPDFEHPDSQDICALNAYVNKELDRLHSSKAFKFIKPLMCQVLGTTKPSFTCTNVNGVCQCCCMGYRPENGQCIQDDSDVENNSDCE